MAENPDLVVMGLMSDDGNFAAVGPMLAELTGMSHATSVVKVTANGSVTVERELEAGATEVVELSKPCLLAVQTGLNQVRYASLKGIMAAKKKPVETKTLADLGLSGKVGAKVKIQKIYPPPRGTGAEMVKGSTDEIVGKLLGKIKELGLL
jgi:electron transfer flavoprotein beta subunit